MSPYFELRQYPMLPGRLSAFHDLMGGSVPPLFELHGFGRPAGFWESHAGQFAPALIYLLPWKSLSARNAAWDAFYSDTDWMAALKANFAGAPRVDHAHVSMLAPSTIAADARPVEGRDELWMLEGPSLAESEAELRAAICPGGLAHGATVRGVFRTVWGGPRSRIAAFLTWTGDTPAGDAVRPMAPGIALKRQRLSTLPYGKPLADLTAARHD